MTARRIGQILTLAVLATSATYMLVYLYRWEWNRAVVSGIFFVAAEVAFVGTTLLRRLRVVEAKLDAHAGSKPTAASRIHETAPPLPDRFAWLRDANGSMSVFVPVLLGAGVVLSLLAHVVERIANATATPVIERRLAARLEPLALPQGGFLAPQRLAAAGERKTTSTAPRWANRAFSAVVITVGVLATVQAVDLVADATQTRPDPIPTGRSVEVTLRVDTKGGVPELEETAEALWVACRGVLNRTVSATEPVAVSANTFRIVVTPEIGDHARRRLVGCLEDATLDRTSGAVVNLVEIPTPLVTEDENDEALSRPDGSRRDEERRAPG